MTFDLITENEKLWAVRYDDCLDNVLDWTMERCRVVEKFLQGKS